MTREEYIHFRKHNIHTKIMHNYAIEKGLNIEINNFTSYLILWQQRIGSVNFSMFVEKILSHYDLLFSITFVNKVTRVKSFNEIGQEVETDQLTTINVL